MSFRCFFFHPNESQGELVYSHVTFNSVSLNFAFFLHLSKTHSRTMTRCTWSARPRSAAAKSHQTMTASRWHHPATTTPSSWTRRRYSICPCPSRCHRHNHNPPKPVHHRQPRPQLPPRRPAERSTLRAFWADLRVRKRVGPFRVRRLPASVPRTKSSSTCRRSHRRMTRRHRFRPA